MLSKNTIKRITGLAQKKYRLREGLFVAEGKKVIQELLDSSLQLEALYSVDDSAFAKANPEIITPADLKKISFLKTPQTALALFKTPQFAVVPQRGLTVVLDDVRDPGNLGTIIRLCDWFGVDHLVCSQETVDCYNPKVVQATMGSLSRVQIVYTDLVPFLKTSSRPIYGTFMDGNTIYDQSLPGEAIIVMGNEANGISSEVAGLVTKRITIPRYGLIQATESLNVAMATSICLSEFKRGVATGT